MSGIPVVPPRSSSPTPSDASTVPSPPPSRAARARSRNPHLLDHIRQGDHIEVWWPFDQAYYRGRVAAKYGGNLCQIVYVDGEVEELDLALEQWRFFGSSARRVSQLLATGCSPRSSTSPGDGDASGSKHQQRAPQ